MYLVAVREVFVADINPDDTLGALRPIITDLPDSGQHPNRTLAVGPDGRLYISIGSTCNACNESIPENATLVRADLQGRDRKIFASGLRNTIGFGWHPVSRTLYGFQMSGLISGFAKCARWLYATCHIAGGEMKRKSKGRTAAFRLTSPDTVGSKPVKHKGVPQEIALGRQAAGVAEMLGGQESLGKKIDSPADLIPAVREGLKYQALNAVAERLGLTREQMAEPLAMPLRTLARRKTEIRLTPQESDRLYRLARIAARTEEVLGSLDKARNWLIRPNRALGNVTPLSLLDTDEGARQVENVLGHIEHGVWN
jgi:putative toxin-antitoxin system antitoxin component (TIGR02293 family)